MLVGAAADVGASAALSKAFAPPLGVFLHREITGQSAGQRLRFSGLIGTSYSVVSVRSSRMPDRVSEVASTSRAFDP